MSSWIGIGVGTLTLLVGALAWLTDSREAGIRSAAIGLLAIVISALALLNQRRLKMRSKPAGTTGPGNAPPLVSALFTAAMPLAIGAGLAVAAFISDDSLDRVVYGITSSFFAIVSGLVFWGWTRWRREA